MTLPERLLELHRALDAAGIAHAFGGAIALAYWTLNPRGTNDIDVNVFVSAKHCARALNALPDGLDQPRGTKARIVKDGQIRLWWDETPVDLFFDYAPVHQAAARNREILPFEGEKIPVLGPTELAVFKAMFDRPRDWLDIAEMAIAGTLDADAVREELARMLGPTDPRFERLEEAIRRSAPGA